MTLALKKNPEAVSNNCSPSQLLESNRYHSIPALEFFQQFRSRNKDILSQKEQAILNTLKILVAGCGSVGGAVVVPLTRLGVSSFVLADPDVYELSNLNRQECYLKDIGSPKAQVLAERIIAINPYACVETNFKGLALDTIEAALDGVHIAFDGIDPEQSAIEKYYLHKLAASKRIPVICGVDFGGKPSLYVFDYRRNPVPFYGKASEEAHRENNFREATKWIGYTTVPPDFLRIVRDRFISGESWPQIAYCVSGLGALGSRVIIDLAMGKPINHIISIDLHQIALPWHQKMQNTLRLPIELIKTLSVMKGVGGKRNHKTMALETPHIHSKLAPVLTAIQLAPSPHNIQPWKVRIIGEDCIRLEWDQQRWLQVADSSGLGIGLSFGCAIESVNTIADIEYQPSGEKDILSSDWHAGEIKVKKLYEAAMQHNLALLNLRGTSRVPFSSAPLNENFLKEVGQDISGLGEYVIKIEDPAHIKSIQQVVVESAYLQLKNDAYVQELWDWLRFSERESDWDLDGFKPENINLGPITTRVMQFLKYHPAARSQILKVGLARYMAIDAGKNLPHSGCLVLLGNKDKSPQGNINSGRAMMRLWLSATQNRIGFQPNHYALSSSDGVKEILSICGVSSDMQLTNFIRLGYLNQISPATHRMPIERIVS